MTIFDIDNTDRICDSLQVRIACGNPTNPTWCNHRRRAGVKRGAKLLTLREAFLVWVCANLYRHSGKRKWNQVTIAQSANAILNSRPQALEQIKRFSGTDPIKGRDIPGIVADLTGVKASDSTFYRRGKDLPGVPRFSKAAEYNAEQVRRFVKAIASPEVD